MSLESEYRKHAIPSSLSFVLSSSAISNITCYEGDLYSKCLHVKGDIKFKNGNAYSGELAYGNLHGQGQITFPDKTIYTG
jgi:hypothetical protein